MTIWRAILTVLVVGLVCVGLLPLRDPTAVVIYLPYAAVGAILAIRRPRQPIAWLLLLIAFSFVFVGNPVPAPAEPIGSDASPVLLALAWLNTVGPVLFYGAFTALAVLVPEGRFSGGRLGVMERVAVAVPVVLAIGVALSPRLTLTFAGDSTATTFRSPLQLAPEWAGWSILPDGIFPPLVAAFVLGVSAMVVRFRRSRGIERQQYKWIAAALPVIVAAVLFAFAMLIMVDPTGTWMWLAAVVAYPLLPVGIGVAVLRYRLFEIDRIISRGIAYALLSAILLGTFATSVLLLQVLVSPLTRDEGVAVAVATLIVATLFNPVRLRLQAVIDRQFNRSHYDAERVIHAFASKLRDEVDLATLNEALAATADQALEPATASVWLRQRVE